MSLDFAVSERQTFGTSFHAPTVKKLLAGKLTMTPHPEWTLPADIDWAADPFDDVNWQNQFHMLRWLDPLRRAAAKGHDDAFQMWLRYVRNWVQSNPRSNPAHKWVWRDMVEGIRVIQFCLAAPLVRDKSPEDLGWLEETIRDHADFMTDPANLGKANHAMHQHEALFVCGRILQDQELSDLAIKRFDELLSEEYDHQGVNGEGAVAYHYNNYLWYERALRRFDAEGVARPSAAARHALAPEEIAHATRPDGTFVSIGDTDGGSPKNVGSPFTDYVTSGGATGQAPSDLVKVYDRGYLFARSGWGETERNLDEETYFSVSFGAANRVHGHPDGGSLTYSANTVNWVVDPGKFQYGYSIPRKHLVSRAAHSLVTVEGRTPRKNAIVSLVRHTESARAHDFLFTDNSFDGVALSRRVIYSTGGDYLVVVDHVRSRQEITGRQRWQLGPDVTAEASRHHVALDASGQKAAIAFAGTATALELIRGQNNPFDGWVATGWKKKTEATAVHATKTGTNFRFITVLAAGSDLHPTVESVPGAPSGHFCLRVNTGRVNELVLVGKETVTFPTTLHSLSSTAAEPSARQVKPSRTGRPHHLDTQSRNQVFALLETARQQGHQQSAQSRSEVADQLLDEAQERGLTDEIDLGITAAVTDLRQTERGRRNPKLVEPHRTALVNWDGDSKWRPTVYPLPLEHHGTRFSTSERPADAGIHTLEAGPLLLPFALDPRAGDTLTVLFQGAIDRARIRVPIFLRWRYQLEMQAGPTLAFADPTLDLSTSMRLGWYLGTEKADLAATIAETVQRVADTLGVRHVVLAGSSGGGFAALQVGAHLPDSVVVAMSPQTDLRRYSPRLVALATEPALALRKMPESRHLLKRVSILERMNALKQFPRTIMVSNPGDTLHVKHHEGPLREFYEQAGHGSRVSTVEVDLGSGHRSVDNETYGGILSGVYETL